MLKGNSKTLNFRDIKFQKKEKEEFFFYYSFIFIELQVRPAVRIFPYILDFKNFMIYVQFLTAPTRPYLIFHYFFAP